MSTGSDGAEFTAVIFSILLIAIFAFPILVDLFSTWLTKLVDRIFEADNRSAKQQREDAEKWKARHRE